MTLTGCEGGCGMDLDEDGREIAAWLRRHPGPQHTPRRCGLERALRAAAQEAFPDWAVEIDPGPGSQPLIVVRLDREHGLVRYGAQYALLDGPPGNITAEQRAQGAVRGLRRQIEEVL